MALLRRIGSIKQRSSGTQSLPRRVDPGRVERERGNVRCLVTLLDDNLFTCDIDVSGSLTVCILLAVATQAGHFSRLTPWCWTAHSTCTGFGRVQAPST